MWSNYQISEKNKEAFEELCKKFRQSPGIFQCKYMSSINHQQNIQEDAQRKCSRPEKVEMDTSTTSSMKINDASVTLLSNLPDITAMQKNVLSSLNSTEKLDIELYKSVEPLTVCNSSTPVISEEVLIQVCKKSEKIDESIAALMGTLLILPKLYHLPSKLSTLDVDALSEFKHWHSGVMVTHVLVPLLQYCPKTEEQHRDILAHLVPGCSPKLVTEMLSAFCARESESDADLPIFHLLCENADQQDLATHTSVLTYLNKILDKYKSSVKFGQCLLLVVKKMGPYIQNHESLQLIVSGHCSSLRKAVELQMKKVMKNR